MPCLGTHVALVFDTNHYSQTEFLSSKIESSLVKTDQLILELENFHQSKFPGGDFGWLVNEGITDIRQDCLFTN